MDTCICMPESLCCSPETTTLILYNSIKNKSLKSEKKKKKQLYQIESEKNASEVQVMNT